MDYSLAIEEHELEIRRLRILSHYALGQKPLSSVDRIKMREIENRLEDIRAQMPTQKDSSYPRRG